MPEPWKVAPGMASLQGESTMSGPIRIHITDDHAVFRVGLRSFIEKHPGLEIVGESADAGLDAIVASKPDILILDINMPGKSAAELVKELGKQCPSVGIIVLTIHDEERYLREFLNLGAQGFLVKTSTGDELITAIKKVARGEQYVDPVLAPHLIARYVGRTSGAGSGPELLTEREREVCGYLALGHTNAEVAEALSISKRTVETHRASIMAKTGLHTRAAIVKFAIDHGLAPSLSKTRDPG
jgi:DNA-binding NarL/FixJ family response regulator